MTVAAYGAIILSLPIILYQAYAYLLPAFSKQQQRAILPLLLLIPVLFIAGVAFGYFVVLPAATKFLLNFNDSQFNIQVRAKEYYGFFAQTLLACGVVFQVPVGILAVTRLGIVKVDQLKQEPPLRLPRLRGRRRGAARRRPGLDAAGDGAADRPLRAQHRPRPGLRRSDRLRRRTGRDRPGGRSRVTTELAPITQRSPIVTPLVTTQLTPNQQLAPISTGPLRGEALLGDRRLGVVEAVARRRRRSSRWRTSCGRRSRSARGRRASCCG